MYGYVYKTTNLINQKVYIGQHKSTKFDPKYYGSGTILLKALKKYGKSSFSIEIVETAESLEELNLLEAQWVEYYKNMMGNNCYNKAGGGTVSTQKYRTQEEKDEFVRKMTDINRARCQSQEFREFCSERFTKLYSDPEEREKQSVKIRKAWSNPELRKEQSERTRKYWAEHPKDNSYNFKETIVVINGIEYVFESTKAMYKFFKEKYDFVPGRDTVRKLISEGKDGPGYQPLFKNKFKDLIGMKIYRKECID